MGVGLDNKSSPGHICRLSFVRCDEVGAQGKDNTPDGLPSFDLTNVEVLFNDGVGGVGWVCFDKNHCCCCRKTCRSFLGQRALPIDSKIYRTRTKLKICIFFQDDLVSNLPAVVYGWYESVVPELCAPPALLFEGQKVAVS